MRAVFFDGISGELYRQMSNSRRWTKGESDNRDMRKRRQLLALMLICLGLGLAGKTAKADSIFASSYVEIAPDGRAWTVDQELTGYGATGLPDFWYAPEEADFKTGVQSVLRQPKAGEHYYKYDRNGAMPVGQWKIAWENPRCIQGVDLPVPGQDYHGLTPGKHRCGRPYFSGWFAYCADCGEPIKVNIYMSMEAAHTITELPLGMDYFYMCPSCRHLEQGSSLGHDCSSISYNRYRVEYNKNADEAKGYMADSLHMYNNAEVFEGSPVMPVKTLSPNRYFQTGYKFQGWNTEPDGTGTFYADGEEIYNLTEENYNGAARRGIVTLYAQWQRVESSLVFDAAGGSYGGENPVRRAYGESYALKGDMVTPPEGHTVFFQTNGGSAVLPVTGTSSFERWEISAPMCGLLTGSIYQFLGDMDAVDRATAVYALNPVTLPSPERAGSSFGGWYSDEDLTALVGFGGDSYIPVRDVWLYAKWVELHLESADNYNDWDGKGAVDLKWAQPDHVNKIYKLYKSEDGGAQYRQISSVSASVEGETNIDREFAFKEENGGPAARTVIIPLSGFYTLTANGAQGGDYGDFKGGLGGSVSGKFYLSEGERLTFTVGGKNGINGGGEGQTFGNGGGMTQISSSRQGILLTAGGGGGASAAGDGQPGGAGTNLVPAGSAGASGMSGGGGGHTGGMAGEHILHYHVEECCLKLEEDYLAQGKTAVTETESYQDFNADGSIFIWQWDSTIEDVAYSEQYNVFRSAPIKTDGIKAMYTEFFWDNDWGEQIFSKTELKIKDQAGRVLKEQTAEQLLCAPTFHNGRNIMDLDKLCCQFDMSGSYEAWIDRFSGYTFSNLTTGFFLDVTPTKDSRDMFTIKVYPVTNGAENWVHVELTDLETGKVYKNKDGKPYRQEGMLSEINIWRGKYAEDGWDVWNKDTMGGGMSMIMRLGCELDESVTEVVVEAQAARNRDEPGFRHDTLKSVVMQTDRIVCGMEEGQCISSKPAYGGSSFINMDHAITYASTAGCVSGNGSAAIKAEETGMTENQELKGVKAPDTAAPYAIAESSILKEVKDSRCVTVTFQAVEDRGTEYFFKAESYHLRTGELMCTSNITKNILKTGLKGYFYLVDENPATEVTEANAANASEPLTEEEITVELRAYTQYLHLAAVDRAGNVSDTVHVEIRRDDAELFWKPYTEDILIDSTVGGRDYDNVYPAEKDRSYYVKADGATPFLLSFSSFLDGEARENYQIDHQIFDIRYIDGEDTAQRHSTKLPYSMPMGSGDILNGASFVRQEQGQFILQDAMYIGASRSNQARSVHFYQAFTMDGSWSGETVTVTPVAGASTPDGVVYSVWEQDAAHALQLVADGEAPIITGLEELESRELIDRNNESLIIEARASDELSGVREFYLQVENLDNFGKKVYTPDENGVIRVEITVDEPVFSGDFVVTCYASDNVGNEVRESRYVTEFALEAEVERILAPHDPVFKRGESGILSITAWGYVDKVEVEFPDFLSGYSQTYDYKGYADYREDKKIQFMIPLYADEGSAYEITVRVYKGDRELEAHPAIRTIRVKDSILDEIRTRLRG